METQNSNAEGSNEGKPLPLSEESTPAASIVEEAPPTDPFLRGSVSRDSTGVVIRGIWSFNKTEEDPLKKSPFEYSYLGDIGEEGSEVATLPPSGEYKGYICLKFDGKTNTKITEYDVEIKFSEDNKITGKGFNKFGRFLLNGRLLEDSKVEITKSYTKDPIPPIPKKRAKEPKKAASASSALKRSRSTLETAPVSSPAAAAPEAAVEEPCMRGEMETASDGSGIHIKGRWALQRSDFTEQPKNTSPFDYSLEGASVNDLRDGPVSGRYAGGFSMKIAGRTKRIKEGGIDFKFTRIAGSDGYELNASGSNEFGIFVMRGTATPSSTAPSQAFSIEIFRTYTSYHPAPVIVPKTGRGWAIEPPKSSVAGTPSSLSRLTSAPASKEPRSGLTASNKASKSTSKMPAPSPLSSGVSDAGRKRKAPSKLVDELNSISSDSGAFDQATRSKLERLMQFLKGREPAVYFLEPVDPVRLGIPTYFDIIKQPMDLKTAERKLVTNQYSTIHEFADDIRLIFSNSKRFNEIDKTMPVYIATLKLETIFENKWRDFETWRNAKLEADREKEAAAAASKSAAAAAAAPKTSEKKKSGNSVRRTKSQTSFTEADEKYLDMQAKMLEMSQEILNLQRATTTQHIQLQIATATNGKKKNGRAVNVSDVLQDDPIAESLLETIPLTLDEKETLTKQVDKLPAAKLNRVIEIIQEQMQLSGFDDKNEEIELDVDTLPIPTLRALQRYLKECFPKRAPPSGVKTPKPKSKKKALPVPAAYVPPPVASQPAPRVKTEERPAKKAKPEPAVHFAPSNGNDTSDSENESYAPVAAPWETSATTPAMNAAESRRNAGLDSDSDDDEPSQAPIVAQTSSSSSSSSSSVAPAAAAVSQVQLVEAVPRDAEVKVNNVDAWGSGWGTTPDPAEAAPELGRERSDSYDDTATNWSQLKTDIQEKHQVDEYRKMEEDKLLQQKHQMQEDAQALARQLQETQKRNEEAARYQAQAEEEAAARRLEEARLAARLQREGGPAMDLDANKTRNNVDSFFENL